MNAPLQNHSPVVAGLGSWLPACPPGLVLAVAMALCSAAGVAQAGNGGVQDASSSRPSLDIGAVLEGRYASQALELGRSDKGFGLGHTEVSLGAAVDNLWFGRLTVAGHDGEDGLETEMEEAYVEAAALPGGVQLRAGRFFSQIGYLNELHSHTDDFSERPLLYRAFLGEHYFDDGARLAWVAPTAAYWRVGAEMFSGRGLVAEPERRHSLGVVTLNTRLGGDIGESHSWQAGVSYVRNRLDPAAEDEEAAEEEGDEHAHESVFTGRHLYLVDAVWKWAPAGNNRERQVRLAGEYARVTGVQGLADSADGHEAWYLAATWRFAPQWEVGARHDVLRIHEMHEGELESARLHESSVALTWKPSHYSALRLQLGQQRDRGGFEDAAGTTVQLQYIMTLGAHSAHAF